MNEIIENLEEAEKLLKTEAFMECCAAERCEECVTNALTLLKQQPPAEDFEEWFAKEYPLPPTVERGPIGRDFKDGCKKAWNNAQALALLKQQPAGEWTTIVRKAMIDNGRKHSGFYDTRKLFEACDRLDTAEADNADLLTACEDYLRHYELHDRSDHPKANMFCTECPRYRKGIKDAVIKARPKQSVEGKRE